MILCVNPNAAIDKTVIVNSFRLNTIQRPERVMALPGGKGCNVARGLKRLGEEPVVTGWVGGYAGQFIADGLRAEGIAAEFVWTAFESRTCLSILDPIDHTLTELYEKGEAIPIEKTAEFKAYFAANVARFSAVTLSGSLPPGVPPDFYQQLIEVARAANIPVLLDSSGAALRQGLAAGPYLIKPNEAEVAELSGRVLKTRSDFAEAARDLSTQYPTRVVISIGAEGAIAADRDHVWHVRPPQIAVMSAVGSGDCLLAGVAFGLTRGFAFETAVQYGVAAGSANALTVGAGQFTLDDFSAVLARVVVEQL
jgi:1-phosphofructokinase family hexose kinase